MKKFLVAYISPDSAREHFAKRTLEQAEAGKRAWVAWMTKAGQAVVDLGASLLPVDDADPNVTGYSIMQAESAEALDEILKDHPHRNTPGCIIEVFECLALRA